MSQSNTQWRVNREGMENCCYAALQVEMYRRKEANEELMINGHTLRCPNCNSEMICDPGTGGRLRWRWNGNESL